MNYEERYLIYGSVPLLYDKTSPFIDTEGNPLSNYLTDFCSFSLTGPSNNLLKITFNDPNCGKWPKDTYIKVYDGDRQLNSSSATLLFSYSDFDTNCVKTAYTNGNTLSVSIKQGEENPSEFFNFSMAVIAVTEKERYTSGYGSSGYSTSNYFYFGFIVFGVFVISIIICVRCCCYNRYTGWGYYGYQGNSCWGHRQRVFAAPATTVSVTTTSINMQPNGELYKCN